MFTLHVFHVRDGHRVEADLGRVSTLLEDPEVTIWLDLEEPLADEAKILHEAFRFHPLAIEDTLQDYGHPKLDIYEDHFFVILHAIDYESLDLLNKVYFATLELDIFVGKRLVVSHHAPGMRSTAALHQEVAMPSKAGHWTALRLFHRLLDRLVDNFIPVIEGVGATLEKLEDDVIQDPAPELLDRILNGKKTIFRLRRILTHQKSILDSLARGHRELVPPDQLAFFRDVYDHFVFVVDQVESFREQVQSIMDAYLSVTSNRMNEIMKVLTQISTVMLPLTFIAGVYGMNFDNMPELHWALGYPFAIFLMLATAAGFIAYFRSRKLL